MIPGFLEKHRLAAAGGCGGGGNGQLPAGLDVGREKEARVTPRLAAPASGQDHVGRLRAGWLGAGRPRS